jgi:hypothetical protein
MKRITKLHHPAIAARMLLDSSMSPVPVVSRSIVQDRHLLFVAKGFDIHMKVSGSGRHRELRGQLVPHLPLKAHCQIVLRVQEQPKARKTMRRFGHFTFRNVPPANVAIEILAPVSRIVASFHV